MPRLFGLSLSAYKNIFSFLGEQDLVKITSAFCGVTALSALARGVIEENQRGRVEPENFQCVSTADHLRLLDAIYHFISPYSGHLFRITKISGGLSRWAEVFKLEVNGSCFAIRVLHVGEYSSPSVAHAEISKEILINHAAGTGDCAPYVHYADLNSRVIIADYATDISGWMSKISDRHLQLLASLLSRIKKIHYFCYGQNSCAKFDYLFEHFNAKAAEINQEFCTIVRTRYLSLQKELENDRVPLTISHHDFNPWNILFDGRKFLVIDWEFARPGNALYDLATVAFFLKLTTEQEQRLLSYFVGENVSLTMDLLHSYYRFKEFACLTYCICTFGLHQGMVEPLTQRELEVLPPYSKVIGEIGDKETSNGRLRNGVTFFKEGLEARRYSSELGKSKDRESAICGELPKEEKKADFSSLLYV